MVGHGLTADLTSLLRTENRGKDMVLLLPSFDERLEKELHICLRRGARLSAGVTFQSSIMPKQPPVYNDTSVNVTSLKLCTT